MLNAVAGGLVGALVGLGIPKEQALKYETEIKAGKFMVIVSGTDEQIDRVQQILTRVNPKVAQEVVV